MQSSSVAHGATDTKCQQLWGLTFSSYFHYINLIYNFRSGFSLNELICGLDWADPQNKCSPWIVSCIALWCIYLLAHTFCLRRMQIAAIIQIWQVNTWDTVDQVDGASSVLSVKENIMIHESLFCFNSNQRLVLSKGAASVGVLWPNPWQERR